MRDIARWLVRRWPTALALGMSALTFGGSESAEGIATLADALVLLQLGYLVIAKLGRRQASWPTIVVGFAVIIALRILDVVSPAAVLSGMALIVLIWAAIDGQLRGSEQFRIQALGMFVFAAIALAGLVLDPDIGRYLVAAGWLLHGIWDFVHLKLDKVVARSHAEWCGVLDVIIAVELVLAL
ncbi:hypothetical protein [Nonomuraea sp. SYSU D8015]|uniref:hypothetical protein n=1 Tax=Nonomuraea sp. SYSU D8015 TaxID=2593644 RepID=UPI001CB738F4|nr:hypothetical protein [Nonomuraea sp. SYSU D8015]